MFSGNVRTYKQRCNQERGYRPVPSANVVARMYRTVSSYSEWIDERRNVGRKDRIAIATRRFLALLSDESKRKFQSVRDGSIISPGLEPRAYRTLQEIEVVGGRSNDVRPEAEMIGRERERKRERKRERERDEGEEASGRQSVPSPCCMVRCRTVRCSFVVDARLRAEHGETQNGTGASRPGRVRTD